MLISENMEVNMKEEEDKKDFKVKNEEEEDDMEEEMMDHWDDSPSSPEEDLAVFIKEEDVRVEITQVKGNPV